MNHNRCQWPAAAVSGFFVLLLGVGLLTFRDYGISWDEADQQHRGLLNYDYITKHDSSLLDSYFYQSYPAVFEICLITIEKRLGIPEENTPAIYNFRHLATFLMFYLSVIFFYFIGKQAFRDRYLAVTGCFMLVVCPCILARPSFLSSSCGPPFGTIPWRISLPFLKTPPIIIGRERFYIWAGGTIHSKNSFPRHYIFVWMGITIPVAYLLFFMAGSLVLFYQSAKRFVYTIGETWGLYCLLWLWIPLTEVVLFKPVIYNGWRHFFFLYPSVVLIALRGYQYFLNKGKAWKVAATFLVYINIISTVFIMTGLHPYEHMYFNGLTGFNMKKTLSQFELPLFIVEFRYAFEYLLRTDPRPVLKVYLSDDTTRSGSLILPADQQKRLFFCGPQDADYYIYDHYHYFSPVTHYYGFKINGLVIDGAEVLSIYKRWKP